MMTTTRRIVGRWIVAGVALWSAAAARADIAATGYFGINVNVPFPFTSGTFDGSLTSFNAGPFAVGGVPVALQSAIGQMDVTNGQIPTINIPALAVTFSFDASDVGGTGNSLGFSASGVAFCTDAVSCSQGQATFLGDVTSLSDPNDLLPDGYVYTFDGNGMVDGGAFDATGVFGMNAFPVIDVPASVGVPSTISSNPTSYYESRHDTLRNFLIDLTFAEVTNPGTVSFVGKSAVHRANGLPASIAVDPTVSILVDIVTGGGLAFTPPVDVCVAYDDVDQNGIVDGTSVSVDTLRVLHAAALGENYQDVTTSVGGGQVCGQVGSLSPFLVAVGPALVTTTTTFTTTSTTIETFTTTTTTTSTTSTTSTTLPGGLVPGGQASSDCYLELVVAGIQNEPPLVEDDKKIFCTDGDACDLGPCGDNVCNLRAGVCINQTDPNVPGCTPPAGLDKLKIKNKVDIAVPQLLDGPQCGGFVDFPITATFNGKGKYQAKKSKQTVKGKATAPKGTKPRKDSDKWTIQCLPRTTACPGSPSGAFVSGGAGRATGGAGR